MKKIYSTENIIMVGIIRGMLEANGIDCHVRNMVLGGAMGELPVTECWPEVWIKYDKDAELAGELIKQALSDNVPKDNWRCQCGETIEGQFGICWSCGTAIPSSTSR